MNYIHQLQNEVASLKMDRKCAREAIVELLLYLQSPKFHDDPTVQVRDVMTRIEHLRSLMMED